MRTETKSTAALPAIVYARRPTRDPTGQERERQEQERQIADLSGYTSNGIGTPGATTSVTSWIIRDPSGVPIAQRYSNGQEYYYLFDGQGDVVALEDPGMVVASYDYCPTGNEADLGGGTNPIRQRRAYG